MAERLKELTPDDAWRAFAVQEAGKEIGSWLEGRGRLHQPIARLTLRELAIMADNAICRFVALASQRIARGDPQDDVLSRFLRGDSPAPCADARREASSSTNPLPEQAQAAGSSAPCAALTDGRPSCGAKAEP